MCVQTAHCLLPTTAASPLFLVSRPHRGLDVAAHVEVAFNLDAEWIAGVHEIFEDDVDDVLVEDFHFPERVDVELQTLQFDTAIVGYVRETNGCEIRKVRERTDAGELRNLEIDFDFFAGKLIRKSVERIELHLFPRSRMNVEALLIGRRQFSYHYAVLDDQKRRALYEFSRDRPIINGVIKIRPAMNPPIW